MTSRKSLAKLDTLASPFLAKGVPFVQELNSQKKILLGKHTFTDDTENVKSVMRVDKSQAPGLNPRRRASRTSVNSVFSAPYSSLSNICDETLRRAYSDDPSNIVKCEMAIRRQSLRTSSLRRGFLL